MPSLHQKSPGNNGFIRRTASRALHKGQKLGEILTTSFSAVTGRNTYQITSGEHGMLCDTSNQNCSQQTFVSSIDISQRDSVDLILEDAPNFFELLEKLQNRRLNDQRCFLPPCPRPSSSVGLDQCGNRRNSQEIFSDNILTEEPANSISGETPTVHCSEAQDEMLRDSSDSPPMVVLPLKGGYWIEQPNRDDLNQSIDGQVKFDQKIEEDDVALAYRKFFLGEKHYNFWSDDEESGPILLSVKPELFMSNQTHWRFLLRRKIGTLFGVTSTSTFDTDSSSGPEIMSLDNVLISCLPQISKITELNLTVQSFSPIVCPKCHELIVAYDEHALVKSYKFGVMCQREGQLTEEEMLSNENSAYLDKFLENLGTRIRLKGHEGYRGGLDTLEDQTGEMTVYDVYQSREVMFHVAPYLPFSESDSQQLERKRHIGNDIATVVFQECKATPFSPDMITSNFLHAFIVVQVIDPEDSIHRRYKVNVAARDDVPSFGPSLPNPPIFFDGPDFHDFLLMKLINAEVACYKAHAFSKLESRTREALFMTLVEEVKMMTTSSQNSVENFSNFVHVPNEPNSNIRNASSRFIEKIRSALTPAKSNKKNCNYNQIDLMRSPSPDRTQIIDVVAEGIDDSFRQEENYDIFRRYECDEAADGSNSTQLIHDASEVDWFSSLLSFDGLDLQLQLDSASMQEPFKVNGTDFSVSNHHGINNSNQLEELEPIFYI